MAVKAKRRRKAKPQTLQVLHAQDGDEHIVGIKTLRVLLLKDGGAWFAQGLEIDYAAAGSSLKNVKVNFGNGLMLTIREHLKMHGTLEKLLQVAPQEVWKEFFAATSGDKLNASFSAVAAFSCHDEENKLSKESGFPFTNIQYLVPSTESELAAESETVAA
jgi:hypothetical protein